jgi:glycosyltransferase involved in cell wall biosynthesis
MNKKLSIVIPVFFNAPSLGDLHSELIELERRLISIDVELELIFVDDGSKDDSFERLLELKNADRRIRVIKLTRNFGSVHAIKMGFQYVSGDCFTVLAADLQDPPELILEMVKRWLDGSKFVICERVSRDDPLMTRIYSKIYYKLLRLLVMKNFPKGGFDMALMDKDMLPYMIKSAKNSYMALLAYWLGYEPEIIHYRRNARAHGKSKWTFAKKFKVFLDVMLGFSVTPIRAISAIGSIVSFISFAYGIVVVTVALVHGNPVAGFTTIVALITFLLGLIILMLGIIGEYLWRIFDETNLRPEAVIEKVY